MLGFLFYSTKEKIMPKTTHGPPPALLSMYAKLSFASNGAKNSTAAITLAAGAAQ
jgi:hypothetical protein